MNKVSFSEGMGARRRLFPRIAPRAIGVAASVVAVMVGLVTPAGAQEVGPAPRLLPTAVPAGYTIDDSFNRNGPSTNVYYVHLLRDAGSTKEFFIGSIPAGKSTFVESILPSRLSDGAKKIKVRGTNGAVFTEGGETRIDWYEKGRWLQVSTTGVTQKVALATAASVVPTKLPDASFGLKKKPVGTATVYAGQLSSLSSSSYGVLWSNPADEQIELFVSNVVTNYIDIAYLGAGSTYVPFTVNGKPGYISQRLSGTTVVWMEQPNLLVEIRSTEFNDAGIVAIAAALVPVTEAAWTVAIAAADQVAPPVGPGDTGVPANTTPVVAETVATVPFSAYVDGQCLVFAAGGVSTKTCILGFTSPNSLAWSPVTASGKSFAVGIVGSNVATVVAKSGAAEVVRKATLPVAGQPGLKYFIVELATPAGVTFSGLDAAGAEVAPAVAAAVK